MKKISSLIMLLIIMALYSCHKTNVPVTPPNPQVDVYVAGYENNGVHNNVAKYWKNGTPVSLTDGTNDANATSIVVLGNDVYVAGQEYKDGHYVAKYWKNGVPVILSDGSANGFDDIASSIAVSGNDVYVAGYRADTSLLITLPKYWKNGQAFYLGFEGGYAYSIALSGNDVYIAGQDSNTMAAYWKNGNIVELESYPGEGLSIAVSGNDVYVAGLTENGPYGRTATVWKNGIPTSLYYNGSGETFVYSVAVSGNDVYVGGWDEDVNGTNVYWKNDSVVHLGLSNGLIKSMAVSGTDVYAAGAEGNNKAAYWKNGILVDLTDGTHNAVAESIFIVKQ